MGRLVRSNRIEKFLNKTLFNIGHIRLVNWHIIHFLSGILLGYFIFNYTFIQEFYISFGLSLNNFQMAFFILAAYELLEWIDSKYFNLVFRKEPLMNIYLDIKFGLFGYLAYVLFMI